MGGVDGEGIGRNGRSRWEGIGRSRRGISNTKLEE